MNCAVNKEIMLIKWKFISRKKGLKSFKKIPQSLHRIALIAPHQNQQFKEYCKGFCSQRTVAEIIP